ncbi:MAG: diguanylate cyclase, partial [Actinobacteria bacterium]|nr:diguanylate cyclase [Actinomycetota bacterium]
MTARILLAGLTPGLGGWLSQRLDDVVVRCVDTCPAARDELRADWDLLVVDTRLAGSASAPWAEIVRLVRRGDRSSPPPVVCCTEPEDPAWATRRELIRELGVSRLLFHPLDREELAVQVAAPLGLAPPEPSRAPGDDGQEPVRAAVGAVWERVAPTVVGHVDTVAEAVAAMRTGVLDEAKRRDAERAAHKVTGSAGTFGFHRASELAARLEPGLAAGDGLDASRAAALGPLVAELHRELADGPTVSPGPGPDGAPALLLLVSGCGDPEQAERITAAAAVAGARAESVAGTDAALTSVATRRPDVVVVDLSRGERTDEGLRLLDDLGTRTPPLPVLVLTSPEAGQARLEAARRGARGFLDTSLPPDKVVQAALQVLESVRATTPTVLAVDDDAAVLEALRAVLEPIDLRLVVLSDPLDFPEALRAASPDLLVLDVDMPVLTGVELCRAVRNDPAWADLSVLFLTAGTDARTVQRVFAAGADDYVTKPLIGPELVVRVTNRLERASLHRRMAEIDPLTGVLNRRGSTRPLRQLLAMAEDFDQPLSLGLLDLDGFKQVNDVHGHAAGDDVLGRLGDLLLQTFRGADVVARWGGEEFMVVMYGLSREEAVARLEGFSETVRRQRFSPWGGGRFGVCFSAGVAQYRIDGGNLRALYRAADQALYAAKAAGRDRVFPAGADAAGRTGHERLIT